MTPVARPGPTNNLTIMDNITFAYKNQAALDRAVSLWQKRLRLQDWTIKAQFVRSAEFGEPMQEGGLEPDVRNSMAHLGILNVIDYDERFAEPYDAEAILVHELVHLALARLAGQRREEETDEEEEIAVNKLADALVKAYRQ